MKSRERFVNHGPDEDVGYIEPLKQREPAEMAEYNPDSLGGIPELGQKSKPPAKYFGHAPGTYEMPASVESRKLLSELPVSRQ